MATTHGVSGINLLPKDSFEFSTLGKFLKWATTAGRVLVVLTEFVVLLAFASRFYFDKKLDDLGEVLIQKEAQIAAYGEVEGQIRKVLAKQVPIEKFQKAGLKFDEQISFLASLMPEGIIIDTLSLNNSGMNISGNTNSEYSFAQMVGGLKRSPKIAMISMKDSNFDQTTGNVKFSILVVFK